MMNDFIHSFVVIPGKDLAAFVIGRTYTKCSEEWIRFIGRL